MYCRFYKLIPLPNHVIPYVMQAGFYYIICFQHIKMDHDLLTALIERWRRETHTFHLCVGEMTPILQDTTIMFGLPINERELTLMGIHNKITLYKRAFRRVPSHEIFKRNALYMRWFWENFFELPDDYDDEILQWYVNTY